MGQPAHRGPAKDAAYDHIKAVIAEIDIDEGRFLTEAEVAVALGVSRTPVREAFLRLEAEGLLQLVPQKGAFVPPVSGQEIEDVMDTRRLIELHCARQVVRDGNDVGPVLNRLIEQQIRATDDVETFIAHDRAFHEAIVSAAGNDVLTRLYGGLRDRQMRMGIGAILHSPQRTQQVIDEHRAIADALSAGDSNGVERALKSHLRNTVTALREHSS